AFLPLGGPIIADYYLIKKQDYDAHEVYNQRKYKWSGIFSFVISAFVGIILEFFVIIPYGLPSCLISLLLSIILYLIIYIFTDYVHDKNETALGRDVLINQ